jgi:hypothetical protein
MLFGGIDDNCSKEQKIRAALVRVVAARYELAAAEAALEAAKSIQSAADAAAENLTKQ